MTRFPSCPITSSWPMERCIHFSSSLLPMRNSMKQHMRSMVQYSCLRKYFNIMPWTALMRLTCRRLPRYQMWTLFFGYASFISAFISIALFAGPKLIQVAKTLISRGKREDKDKLNKLMEPYKDVPLWWYLTLFLICFTTNMVLIFKQQLYLPWWTFIVALLFGSLTVVVCHMKFYWSNLLLCFLTRRSLISQWDIYMRSAITKLISVHSMVS